MTIAVHRDPVERAAAAAQGQVISNFSGNIDGTEPQSFEVDNASCTVIEPLNHFYETFPVSVTASGAYDYTDLSISFDLDMQLTVYTDSYDPGDILTNCVTRFDDSGTVTLNAGTQYVFVVQPLFDATANTGDWEFELDGPGEVLRGTQAEAVPALPLPGLFALIGLLGLGVARALRRR
ncbi:MAG TPA: hypothetical protein VJ947_00780 [Pseudohaliea sp.]|nr:hypothetical protein [Pseudohaliea sp.]